MKDLTKQLSVEESKELGLDNLPPDLDLKTKNQIVEARILAKDLQGRIEPHDITSLMDLRERVEDILYKVKLRSKMNISFSKIQVK